MATTGYRIFGTAPGEVSTDKFGNFVGGVTYKVWDSVTGGSRITDLLDLSGAALPGVVKTSSDEDNFDFGRPFFQAAEENNVLYLDRGYGVRFAIMPQTIGQQIDQAFSESHTAWVFMQQIAAQFDPAEGAALYRTYSVDAHGAVGDGLTDDTAAVQSAIDAARAAGGGVITFTAGKAYYFHGQAHLCSNLWMQGNGAKIIKKPGQQYYSAFTVNAADMQTGKSGYGSGCENLLFTDFTLVGDAIASTTGGCLASLRYCDNVVALRCRFEKALALGHNFDLTGCRHVRIAHSQFLGRSVGDSGYEHKEAIQVDIVREESGADLPSQHITVEDCQFLPYTEGAVTLPAPAAVGAHSTPGPGLWYEHITFRNNLVMDTIGQTSYIRGAFHMIAARYLTIEGNTFLNRAGNDAMFVNLMGKVDSANTMVPCTDAVIRANHFEGVTPTQPLVSVDGGSRVVVEANTGRGLGNSKSSAGVFQFAGVSQLLVAGNPLEAAAGTFGYGILVGSSCSDGKMYGNIVRGFTTNERSNSSTVVNTETRPEIQSGSVAVSPDADTPSFVTVTFPVPFSSAPIVVVSPLSTVPGIVAEVSAVHVTKTQFDAVVYRTNTTSTIVNWIAHAS